MGLLDDFSNFVKTPEGMGLLSGLAGWAANARHGTPRNNVGRGAMSGVMGYSNALEQADKRQENALQRQLLTGQVDALTRQNATRKLLEEAMRDQGGAQPSNESYGVSPATYAAFGVSPPQEPVKSQPATASYADKLMAAAMKAGDTDAYQKAYQIKLEEKKLEPTPKKDIAGVLNKWVTTDEDE